MTRRSPGRPTRQILSGSQLARPGDAIGGQRTDNQPISFAFAFLLALSVLVIASAIVWAIWGTAAASAILLLLALGLIASWLVV